MTDERLEEILAEIQGGEELEAKITPQSSSSFMD